MKILIAEDDKYTRDGLTDILQQEGYEVVAVADGEEALRCINEEQPNLLCLDIMMPKLDGYQVCRQVREKNKNIPILFVSAKSEEIDKVVGLELGADDFITKPFGVKEVVARIRAVTRRCLASDEGFKSLEIFELADLKIYPSSLRAQRKDYSIDLSLREIKILELFYLNPGEVLERNYIFRKVWGNGYFPNSRTLDQQISTLRKKIEHDHSRPEIIQTVHGMGYKYSG